MNRITRWQTHLIGLMLAGAMVFAPEAFSQDVLSMGKDGAVSVKVNGDIIQYHGETSDVIVLVRGSANIQGRVEVLVIVDGTAELTDAEIGELIIVRGEALLLGTTHVTGDVRLIDAAIEQEESVEILGEVLEDMDAKWGPGAAVFGVIFGVGFMLAVLFAGVVLALLAPHAVRRVGMAIIDEPLKTIGAGLFLWIVLPLAAVMAMMTIIGLPVAMGILIFVLPLLSFTGYLVTGIRVGDLIIERLWGSAEFERPIQTTILGVSVLLILGWIPFIGFLVTPLASFLGAGALALSLWRVMTQKEPWHRELEVA